MPKKEWYSNIKTIEDYKIKIKNERK